jgi:oxalate---CoA ligase
MTTSKVDAGCQVYESIPKMLEEVSRAYFGEVALDEKGKGALSYGEVNALVRSLVVDLRSAGVKREDRVAVVIPNGREMCTTLLGVCSAAIAAPLNPGYQESEFADYFREIRVSFLVIRRGVPSPARIAAAKMGIRVLEVTPEADAIVAEGEKVQPPHGEGKFDLPNPHDIALILLTSGSTGRSKKVPLTHRNLCVSVRDICRTLELTPGDRCLCMWEQFHIGGLVDLLMVPLASGGSVICTAGFDAGRFYELLESKLPTWYQGVPATVHELMAHARKHGIAGVQSQLKFVRVTASALSPKLMEELEAFFGVPVITTFGMTEAAPLITTNLLPPHVRKPGSTGPSCGPEIVIRDEEGKMLETGEVGEVLIRGENIISGYEDAPEANARSFCDGWFRTGDTGCLDGDGYLFLKGRIKESINRGGEKITPQEIDDVLLTHPEIAEAISFHVPHSVLGEDVAVAVVLHRPGSLTENDVREYVAARMVEFKVPRKVFFVEGFARNASGKVNRSTLAETLGLEGPADYEDPATSMEKTLAEIWKRELGVARVGANDRFAELGGDSLSGVRLILEIEKALGKPLPVRALYRLSTVREMAEFIETDGQTPPEFAARIPEPEGNKLSFDDYRAMLAVLGSGSIPVWRPGSLVKAANLDGSRPAIFWVFNRPNHEMEALINALGPDQPLYCLYSGSNSVDLEKISAIAEHYIKEIQAIQPAGPLIIGGNCRGGRVAIRIAGKLRELGRKVSHLCILEMFERPTFDFDGELLFLFGKQSTEFRYRDFHYGRPSWKLPFRKPPRVEWVQGLHTKYFAPGNVGVLAERLRAFLDGVPADRSASAWFRERTLLFIHRVPFLFRAYVRRTAST